MRIPVSATEIAQIALHTMDIDMGAGITVNIIPRDASSAVIATAVV